MSLEKIYDYFHHYDSKTYQVVACMGNEPSEEEIQDFEKLYQISLPDDFREFTMSPLGGLYMEVREELWPRAKAFDVAPFWTFCRGIKVYGIANEIPDFLDIRLKTKELHELGFVNYIPFLSIIGDGDVIFCFDKNNHIVALDWYSSGEAEELDSEKRKISHVLTKLPLMSIQQHETQKSWKPALLFILQQARSEFCW